VLVLVVDILPCWHSIIILEMTVLLNTICLIVCYSCSVLDGVFYLDQNLLFGGASLYLSRGFDKNCIFWTGIYKRELHNYIFTEKKKLARRP
jgi:hypothetical protein